MIFQRPLIGGLLTALTATSAGPAWATDPSSLLKKYKADVVALEPGFQDFLVQRGKELYFFEGTKGSEKISCSTCHTSDARKPGKSRAGKEIAPLAPSAHPESLTSEAKVEKWFKRTCGDVLGRECTAKEKGDFITYLLSLK